MINLGVGCSLEDFKDKKFPKDFSLINIENPLYPGYLEKYNDKDLLFIKN